MAKLYALGASSQGRTASITDPSTAAWRPVLISWAILVVMMLAIKFPLIAAMRFSDPDDALRLVQVRDLLAGQSWFDVHQYRVAAPAGVAMHWSRLVDLPIAGMILLLRPLIGTHAAELATVVAIPLLMLLCALALAGRLAARFFRPSVVGLACISFGLAVPVLWQFTPMRIDHHAWQIVLALAALNGLYEARAWRGGAMIGLAFAASLAISIEGLPLTVLFLGVCALRGLRNPSLRFDWLRAATVSLAVGSAAFFLATRGTYDLATHCDGISPVHLALFAWTAIGTMGLYLAAPRGRIGQVAGLAVIGAGAAAIFLGIAPQCRGGTFVMLDPLIMRFWYPSIAEGMPFWNARPHLAASIVAGPLIGLYGAWRLWRETPAGAQRNAWLDHLLVLCGAWLIGLMVARASATALVFAAVPAAAQIVHWIERLRAAAPVRRMAGYSALAMLIVPGIPVALAAGLVNPSPVAANRTFKDTRTSNGQAANLPECRYDLAGLALDRLAPIDILVPLDMGPDILVNSHQRVVATGHHRGAAAMHDVIAAFMAPSAQARMIMQARHASLVIICPEVSQHSVYASLAPDGLMARLLANRPPDWLVPVDLAPGSGLRFWRVVP